VSRVVSVLQVVDVAIWTEIEVVVPLGDFVLDEVDPLKRVVDPRFEGEPVRLLREAGVEVLVRYVQRPVVEVQARHAELVDAVNGLPHDVRTILWAAQRHALNDVVLGLHAWDPEQDGAAVRHLHGLGLLRAMPSDSSPYFGPYKLDDGLPAPPAIELDFEEAVMDETDDLAEPGPGTVQLLHDVASLAAALHRVGARRTHNGTLSKTDTRKLGRQLGLPGIARDGRLLELPRYKRAMSALEALGAVSMDPISRVLFIDLGLESTLAGTTPEAVDRLVHRLVDRDLHVVIPAVREALRQAGDGAIDEVVFLDLLREQQRQILFPRWQRRVGSVYPAMNNATVRPYDDKGWDRVESRLIGATLKRCERLGLLRRAPGVFAATEDGRLWAGSSDRATPPLWVSSDLELVVPPEAVTPWERFQLERLGHCQRRDTVDTYRLERAAVVQWLATHELDQALDLLRRRSPGVPLTVVETLTEWRRSAERVVLVCGVIVDDPA
jgi:hypothetical protein